MPYSKTVWSDGQNKYDIKSQADATLMSNVKFVYAGTGGTSVSATNMNKIENQLETLTNQTETPSYSTEATANAPILGIPTTAMQSQLDLVLKGNTDINLIRNGNFTSTTGWLGSNGTIAVSNNVLSLTGSGASASAFVYQTVISPVVTSQKYYVRCIARVTNSSATAINLQSQPDSSGANVVIDSVSTPTSTRWYMLSGVVTVPTDNTGNLRLRAVQVYADATTANAKVMEVKEFMAIDLTAKFGAGNEPTTAQCDLRYNAWFDDLGHTLPTRIKSCGKNLLDINSYIDVTGATASVNFNENSITFIPGGTNTSQSFYAYLYEVPSLSTYSTTKRSTLGNSISSNNNTSGGNKTNTLTTTDANLYRLQFGINGSNFDCQLHYHLYLEPNTTYKLTFNISTYNSVTGEIVVDNNVQLEKSSTVTYATRTYEPYYETQVISPVTLRAVSETVRDTYNVNIGLYTKNVSDVVSLLGNTYSSYTAVNDYTGYKWFRIQNVCTDKFGDYNVATVIKYDRKRLSYDVALSVADRFLDYDRTSSYGNLGLSVADTDSGWDEAWNSATSFTGMTWANLIKAYFNGWKLTTANTNVASCVWTGIASGTTQSGSGGYTTVTTTQDVGYTPYRLIYQLKEATTINYLASVLNSVPNGKVDNAPFIEDIGLYATNIAVENSSYSIRVIDYVYKVNTTNGALTKIPAEDLTYTIGGTTFTIAGASAGDFYLYGYTYYGLSNNASMTHTYATDLKAQVDNNSQNIDLLDDKVKELQNYTESNLITVNSKIERYGASATGNDSYSLTNAIKSVAYYAGMTQTFKADVSNTGTATLNVDGLGAKALKKWTTGGKADVATGDIIANGFYTAMYDGSDFIIINPTAVLHSLAIGNSGKALISNGSIASFGYSDILKYSASDNVILTSNTENGNASTGALSYQTAKTFKIKYSGGIRIKGEIKTSNSSYPCYIKIIDAYDRVLASTSTSSTTYVTFSLDATYVMPNIDIYIQLGTQSGYLVNLRNVTICADEGVASNTIT